MNLQLPTLPQALDCLAEAENRNPGPWIAHSRNTAEAGRIIASKTDHLDPEPAYIMGLLHDIGRREGVTGMRHVYDGYHFLLKNGWFDAARIALTHSFPVPDVRAGSSKWDASPDEIQEIQDFMDGNPFDDYDRLFQLCDSLSLPDGYTVLEVRWVGVLSRYENFNEFTVPKWQAIRQIKTDLENLIGQSIYRLLPGIEEKVLG